MISYAQILLAARAHALGMTVCTTNGAPLLESSVNGGHAAASAFIRSAGSFHDDGFAAGMEVTPSGFPTNEPQQVVHISDDGLIMTVAGALANVAAAGARSITCGFPSVVSFGGLHFDPPQGQAWGQEIFTPGGTEKIGLSRDGDIEARPTLSLNIGVPSNNGELAAFRYVDALFARFASGVVLTLVNGDVARVRGDLGPSALQFQYDIPGFCIAPVKISLRLRTANPL